MQTCIRIHPKDSVAVALQPLSAGTWISESNPGQSEAGKEPVFLLKEDIPAGHKFALRISRPVPPSSNTENPSELPARISRRARTYIPII